MMVNEVKIQNSSDREQMVSILAHAGYMVWVEKG